MDRSDPRPFFGPRVYIFIYFYMNIMQKESLVYSSIPTQIFFPLKNKLALFNIRQISHTALSTKSLPIPGLICYTRFALLHFKDLKLNRSEREGGRQRVGRPYWKFLNEIHITTWGACFTLERFNSRDLLTYFRIYFRTLSIVRSRADL